MNAKKLFEWGRRYVTLPLVGVVCFVVYMWFFNDENSVMTRMEYQNNIDDLNAEISSNNDSLEYYHRLNASLETNRDDIERIVREHYHMKRDNEDVYVFE